jgi:hypothetical protein
MIQIINTGEMAGRKSGEINCEKNLTISSLVHQNSHTNHAKYDLSIRCLRNNDVPDGCYHTVNTE